MTPWAKWFQDNFDKLLLSLLWMFAIFVVLHMAHDSRDNEHISWAREVASGLLGALLGLITGARLASVHRDTNVNIDSDLDTKGKK